MVRRVGCKLDIISKMEDSHSGLLNVMSNGDPRASPNSQSHADRTNRFSTGSARSNLPPNIGDKSESSALPSQTSRVYITEFSEDGDDDDFDRDSPQFTDDDRSINILDDDDSGSVNPFLPHPVGAVDIENPDGYDTDLEIDGDEFVRESVEYDPTGIKDYVAECNKLGVIPVAYFERHVQDREFVMRHHGLGPLGAKAISKPLQGNTMIESLNLEGNCIEGNGSVHICKVLRDNCYITKLVLSENELGAVGAKAVFQMLSGSQTITEVDLSGNGFRDTDGESIYTFLEKNRTVRTLNLRHNKFEIESARYIRDAMVHNVTLRHLDLSWNNFRLKGATYLAEMIQDNYGLKHLNLSMNGLGNGGARAMGHALTHNQCLEELNLSNNRIGDEGTAALAKGLEGNDTLIVFRMGHNPLSCDGPLPFLVALYRNDNTSLTVLDLTNVVVTDEFDKKVDSKLREEKERQIQIIHGGLLFKKKQVFSIDANLESAFDSDPMTKLKAFADKNKLRLVDVFRRMDRDQSMSLSKEEFIKAIDVLKKYGLNMTVNDVNSLMHKLDKDGDGEIDFSELMNGDYENREARRRMKEWKIQREQMIEEGENPDEIELPL